MSARSLLPTAVGGMDKQRACQCGAAWPSCSSTSCQQARAAGNCAADAASSHNPRLPQANHHGGTLGPTPRSWRSGSPCWGRPGMLRLRSQPRASLAAGTGPAGRPQPPRCRHGTTSAAPRRHHTKTNAGRPLLSRGSERTGTGRPCRGTRPPAATPARPQQPLVDGGLLSCDECRWVDGASTPRRRHDPAWRWWRARAARCRRHGRHNRSPWWCAAWWTLPCQAAGFGACFFQRRRKSGPHLYPGRRRRRRRLNVSGRCEALLPCWCVALGPVVFAAVCLHGYLSPPLCIVLLRH